MGNNKKKSRLDRSIVKVGKIGREKPDSAFWQSRSHQERIDALEEIRKEFNSWKYGTAQRLQRVYRILKYPQG